jgi:hypothetical protein
VQKKTQSKDWVFCATKCFKQITEQYEYYIGKGGRALGVKNDWVNREKVLIAKFVNSRQVQ